MTAFFILVCSLLCQGWVTWNSWWWYHEHTDARRLCVSPCTRQENGKNLICGDGWDDVKQHYKIRNGHHVMVHVSADRDFLRVNALNTSHCPKKLIDQPGYALYIYIESLSTKLYMDMHTETSCIVLTLICMIQITKSIILKIHLPYKVILCFLAAQN